MNEEISTLIQKDHLRSLVENYLTRLDNFWTGILDREIGFERERLAKKRWFIFPAKIPNATMDDARTSLIYKWNHHFNSWNAEYLDAKEQAELLLKLIDDSAEDSINVPFNRYFTLTKEKLSN